MRAGWCGPSLCLSHSQERPLTPAGATLTGSSPTEKAGQHSPAHKQRRTGRAWPGAELPGRSGGAARAHAEPVFLQPVRSHCCLTCVRAHPAEVRGCPESAHTPDLGAVVTNLSVGFRPSLSAAFQGPRRADAQPLPSGRLGPAPPAPGQGPALPQRPRPPQLPLEGTPGISPTLPFGKARSASVWGPAPGTPLSVRLAAHAHLRHSHGLWRHAAEGARLLGRRQQPHVLLSAGWAGGRETVLSHRFQQGRGARLPVAEVKTPLQKTSHSDTADYSASRRRENSYHKNHGFPSNRLCSQYREIS